MGTGLRSIDITIDLAALQNNLLYAKRFAPESRIFSVLKADAYGHGLIACANALKDITDGFAVVVPGEAFALREAGIESPILVIQGVTDQQELTRAVVEELWLGLHSMEQLLWMRDSIDCCQDKKARIWLKIDTGMGRLGLKPDDLPAALAIIQNCPYVELIGCLTHFSCADETGHPFTAVQIERFSACTSSLQIPKSLCNSAGVLNQFAAADWVRPGIMLYGANPLDRELAEPLQSVMTVKAPVIAVRQIDTGESVGYGNTFVAQKPVKVAVVAIGYGDGYPRHMKEGACTLLNGVFCRLLGRVSMDSIVLELPDNHDVAIGDLAVCWGKGLPVEQVAQHADTISYELLCQIRGERRYLAPQSDSEAEV